MNWVRVICVAGWLGVAGGFTLPAASEGFDETPTAKPQYLADKELNAFFAEVEKKMSGLKSIAATFQQEKRLALFKDPLLSNGQILFSTPDHLRWEFRKPFRSILIVSGDEVAKFEDQKSGWRKVEQGRQAEVILVVMDNIRSWFRGDFDRAGDSFEVSGARKPHPVILMKPKDKVMARTLREVELRLADDFTHVVQVTIREASGDQTVMKFDQVERKPSDIIAAKYFSLEKVVEVDAQDLASKDPEAHDSSTGRGSSEKDGDSQ